MENFFSFAGIIMIIFGILQIILFFKLWGMTNDIKAIKNKYLEYATNESSTIKVSQPKETEIENKKPERIVTPKFIETQIGEDSSFLGGSQLKYTIDFEDGTNAFLYRKNSSDNLFRIQCNKMSVYYTNKESAIDALYLFLKTGKISNTDRTYI